MSAGQANTQLTGSELLEFINSRNTQQRAFGSVDDIAAYLRELGLPAELLMIVLLQDISKKLDIINEITVALKINNMYLSEITGEHFTDQDVEL